MTSNAIPPERIERRILLIRGHKVMLSPDLAELYGVIPKVLIQAVKRNIERFPSDFMFQLTREEFANLKSQIVTSAGAEPAEPLPTPSRSRVSPCFRACCAARAPCRSTSPSCVHSSNLREILATNRDLARRLDELESKYDAQFRAVFDAIRELMRPPQKPRRRIGFAASSE